ncbi:helix-turn-helix domain-containing protein [Leptobacterium flavescens]|uniref:Helix-turn-helix domain-containing protein n=1 Tax=Leptobacterium flavescens TaxID=472055 RepID=A0A6P0UVP8_9FLAO|nr:helix-turn-helix transcriptional regulator [Leptobacterium flavescens]NER14873.1 helix-turn-helix domain-containing protein [Leptobacterium flavescens]
MEHELKSISQIHQAYDLEKPKNPLISIIDMANYVVKDEWINVRFTNSFYYISLKDGSCGLEYGRNTYDFEDGVMSFMAPGQVFSVTSKPEREIHGWMLYFHPELIRNTPLAKTIDDYNFFSYSVHEALHLSDQEQKTITDCVKMIEEEIRERIDKHSRKVIASGLEFLLNFCSRFYERQFNTRASTNKDVLSVVETALKEYYSPENYQRSGLPTVGYLAEKANLSPGYLSDLLRNETGKSAKEHIHLFLIEKAKTILLNSRSTVSEIAYDLGFEYPQHFSKMFKTKTGMSPGVYRNLN